ncbi:MAG: YicC/YloC family endoribonuclease [Pseudomonadota bacterium]
MAGPQSMTGFGRAEIQNNIFEILVEIKSVNHRFKDNRFRMPPTLSSLEMELRKKIDASFKRGSFDVFIGCQKSRANPLNDLDHQKIKDFLSGMKELTKSYGVSLNISPSDLLRNEFSLDKNDKDIQELGELVRKCFDCALLELVKSRQEEGGRLVEVLKNHYFEYEKNYTKVCAAADQYRDKVEGRLRKSFAEMKEDIRIDEARFGQEVIYYLEKLDISEEINRIKIHLDKFNNILCGEGEIGRHLDFLLQELNRETNTIGSKSALDEISQTVVNMKVELEQIREQVANLE